MAKQPQKTEHNVALITGAAQRIGKAIALNMADHGWDIALHYNTSANAAEKVVTEIQKKGQKAVAIRGNLSSQDDVASLIPQCVKNLGTPTCLINNASLFKNDDIENLTSERWQAHIDTNLRAPVFLAQAFSNTLKKKKKGNIINIIDQRVWRLTPLFISYTIAKSGLWTATQTLAQALAPNIRVNAIGPGPVLQSVHQSKDQFAKQAEATLLERSTDPKEIAAAVDFIINTPSMTGQMLALDNGQHLAWQTPDIIGVEGEQAKA
ncbi:MAG: SDR family oxidoreductase [Pseudomonadota bacterium]